MVLLIFAIHNFYHFKDNNKNIFVKLIISKPSSKCPNHNLKDTTRVLYKKRANSFSILKPKRLSHTSIWSFNHKLNINSAKHIYL